MPRKGLDILGQKSWHVLRRHNVERVLKDEREERERQEKEAAREARADAEARLNALRAKSGNRNGVNSHDKYFMEINYNKLTIELK